MALLKPSPKNGRLGSKKSNGGCFTCKIRKVKCDELRPDCRRCASTGRKCDGYDNGTVWLRQRGTNTAMIHVKHPTTFAQVQQVETQSFQFFIRRVVPGLSGVVDKPFWQQLIPQLCHTHPVIWDAVVALSCLIQHPQYTPGFPILGLKKPPPADAEHRRALLWYNKSISGLRKGIKRAPTRSTTTVVCCILYICIESLQDNFFEAITLYQRACEMMEMQTESRPDSAPMTYFERSIERTVRDLLQNMGAAHRLAITSPRSTRQIDTAFQSLSEARDEFAVLLFEAYHFIKFITDNGLINSMDWKPPAELICQQQDIQQKFLEWRSALEDMMNNPNLGSDQKGDPKGEPYCLLLVGYGHYFILLSTSLSTRETAFDNFFPTFQDTVDHASYIIAAGAGQPRPVFVFETRVVPTLFFVATKCRHPMIRRQAISLLRNAPEIENTWKADRMADVAEWVVGVEESGLGSSIATGKPEEIELPLEHRRVYWDLIGELQDPEGPPVGSGGENVIFSLTPATMVS